MYIETSLQLFASTCSQTINIFRLISGISSLNARQNDLENFQNVFVFLSIFHQNVITTILSSNAL